MANIHQLMFTYSWLKSNYTEERYEPIIFQRAIDLAFACLRVKDLDKNFLNSFLENELSWKTLLTNKKSAKSCFVMVQKIFPLHISKLLYKIFYRFVYK